MSLTKTSTPWTVILLRFFRETMPHCLSALVGEKLPRRGKHRDRLDPDPPGCRLAGFVFCDSGNPNKL